MSFESAKSMGQAGTLLIILLTVGAPIVGVTAFFLGLLPSITYFSIIGGIISYLGYILFLIAMNRFANYYGDHRIFSNALYGFLTSLAGTIALITLLFGVFLAIFTPLIGTSPAPGSPATISIAISLIAFVVVIWLSAFVIALIQGIFFRRAFNALAEKSGNSNLKQAGFLMFLGGALTIIAVGGLIFFVGWIYAVLGFFSIKPKPPQTYSTQQAPLPSHVRYCPNCGAENPDTALFCSRCGNKL